MPSGYDQPELIRKEIDALVKRVLTLSTRDVRRADDIMKKMR